MPGRILHDQDEIDRRHALGQDGYDEVWEGIYHVVPMAHSRHGEVQAELLSVLRPYATAAGLRVSGPFNLGVSDQDFRVPDGALFRAEPNAVYVPTVPLLIEILSPDDETFEKFPFYAARQVEEVLVADPQEHTVRCWHRTGDTYQERDHSSLLSVPAAEIAVQIRWPAS